MLEYLKKFLKTRIFKFDTIFSNIARICDVLLLCYYRLFLKLWRDNKPSFLKFEMTAASLF